MIIFVPRVLLRWLGVIAPPLVIGWVFILWQNRFHVTPPVVIVSLGWLAVVAAVFNLWRTGAVMAAHNDEDDGGASWGLPIGERGELEREKKTLLKAIREAEFDHQMGKLSKGDVADMVGTYRARAIEVIKEIDRLDLGTAGTARQRIEREIKARLGIDDKVAVKPAAIARTSPTTASTLADDPLGRHASAGTAAFAGVIGLVGSALMTVATGGFESAEGWGRFFGGVIVIALIAYAVLPKHKAMNAPLETPKPRPVESAAVAPMVAPAPVEAPPVVEHVDSTVATSNDRVGDERADPDAKEARS